MTYIVWGGALNSLLKASSLWLLCDIQNSKSTTEPHVLNRSICGVCRTSLAVLSHWFGSLERPVAACPPPTFLGDWIRTFKWTALQQFNASVCMWTVLRWWGGGLDVCSFGTASKTRRRPSQGNGDQVISLDIAIVIAIAIENLQLKLPLQLQSIQFSWINTLSPVY